MKYVFMLALPRSGSTLLAYVLDSHSRIHVEHEDSGRPNRTLPDKEAENLRTKIGQGFESYLNALLAARNKEVLVTSRYFSSRHVKLIAGALGPGVPFIVLRRRRMWRAFRDADGTAHMVSLQQLLKFEACRRLALRVHPHVEISYEAMVSDPCRTFSRVCAFVGVAFEPEMLDYARFEHGHLAHRGNAKTRRLGRIVDTVTAEPPGGKTLLRDIAGRIAPAWLPPRDEKA